jgi:hypothetical protein
VPPLAPLGGDHADHACACHFRGPDGALRMREAREEAEARGARGEREKQQAASAAR